MPPPPVNVEIPLSLVVSSQLKHIGLVVPKLIMLYQEYVLSSTQARIYSFSIRLSQQGMLKTNVQCMIMSAYDSKLDIMLETENKAIVKLQRFLH